jgi:hypothetical protein
MEDDLINSTHSSKLKVKNDKILIYYELQAISYQL